MATWLNYPYDPELFLMQWRNEPDPTLTAILNSGAMQNNAQIQSLIANGSNFYTIPFYNVLGGTPDNYNGVANINMTTPDGNSQNGIVYGRAHSWKDQDFVRDFNSGADPMRQITSQVAKFWAKKRQNIMLGSVGGVFSVADDETSNWDNFQLHTTSLATATTSVTSANKFGATTASDAVQKALGDNFGLISMAIMHSRVANNLGGLQLLEYRKYTDPMGITRTLAIADLNGLMVVIDDGVPVGASASASGEKEYTTYLMGAGALQYAPAPVDTPVETGREALTTGGYNYLVTRFRETMHPNGFSFVIPQTGFAASPTDAQLSAGANWKLVANAKNIPMVRVITNG